MDKTISTAAITIKSSQIVHYCLHLHIVICIAVFNTH